MTITAVNEKLQALDKEQKLLWPKFDQDLNGKLDGKAQVTQFVNEVFKKCKLEKDLAIILKQRSIEDGLK